MKLNWGMKNVLNVLTKENFPNTSVCHEPQFKHLRPN